MKEKKEIKSRDDIVNAKCNTLKGLDKGLLLPESNKFGLDRGEAAELGINKGIEEGKHTYRDDYYISWLYTDFAAFYNRPGVPQ